MSERTVSQLDQNGYFLCAAVADESPLEPGVFLIPGGCIDAEPPTVPDGFWAKFNGSAFVMEEIVEEPPPIEEPAPEMAPICTPWQLRKALNAAGYREQIEQAIANSTDQNLKDGWEYATYISSDDPFVISLGELLEKTPAETTEFIQNAATL